MVRTYVHALSRLSNAMSIGEVLCTLFCRSPKRRMAKFKFFLKNFYFFSYTLNDNAY
jgi:hypothetical protein